MRPAGQHSQMNDKRQANGSALNRCLFMMQCQLLPVCASHQQHCAMLLGQGPQLRRPRCAPRILPSVTLPNCSPSPPPGVDSGASSSATVRPNSLSLRSSIVGSQSSIATFLFIPCRALSCKHAGESTRWAKPPLCICASAASACGMMPCRMKRAVFVLTRARSRWWRPSGQAQRSKTVQEAGTG